MYDDEQRLLIRQEDVVGDLPMAWSRLCNAVDHQGRQESSCQESQWSSISQLHQ